MYSSHNRRDLINSYIVAIKTDKMSVYRSKFFSYKSKKNKNNIQNIM